MQIQGDYHPHSGSGYEPAHTHHITKCLREEEHTKQQTGGAGIKSKALSAGTTEEKAGAESFIGPGSGAGARRQSGAGGGRAGFIREFWDSLGEEKTEKKSKESVLTPQDEEKRDSGTETAKISAVSATIRQLVPAAVITRIGTVREKIKAGIGTALKRFGKREDAFGALSNPGNYFEGKRKGKEGLPEKAGKGSRRADREIITATVADSYLMDSYSKTGRYCRLNENMIYQKSREDKEDNDEKVF